MGTWLAYIPVKNNPEDAAKVQTMISSIIVPSLMKSMITHID